MTTMAIEDSSEDWWRTAVVYQVYPRSFADSDGDGIGDLRGILQHLDHLKLLGVDVLWLGPVYRSPQDDFGYDISDYEDVDPVFGTLADADALIAAAHHRGLRVVLDLVPNHTSDEHAWFAAALAAGPGSPERARYLFRDGTGEFDFEPDTVHWLGPFRAFPVDAIVGEVRRLLADPVERAAMSRPAFPFGDGTASRRIAEIVADWLGARRAADQRRA